jgi:hypothetical protein
MLNITIGIVLFFAQLSGPGSALPQVLHPEFKVTAPIKAGGKGEVRVAFKALQGYAINHTPPIGLKLTAIPELKLDKVDFTTATSDPKSPDEYYVDLPTLSVPLTASKAGRYEIPGQLVYYFCSKADGFCSRQTLGVKIPITVE